jgi:FkbM family methyltransferase
MSSAFTRKIIASLRNWKYEISKGNSDHAIDKDDPALREKIFNVFHRYYIQGHRGNDVVISDISRIQLDGHPDYIPEMLSRDQPHDEDYIVFRSFQDKEEVILDVGANWGYSAGSMWSVGTRSQIVSFEAIPLYRDCLAKILAVHSEGYNYLMTALSSRPGVLKFAVPVINDTALTALTSADANPHLDSLTENVYNSVHRWMSGIKSIILRICEFEVPVQTLDSVLASHPELIPRNGVSIIKLDVEGWEYEVLKGAINTLRTHNPLIMAEGGNRRQELRELMIALDYSYAERKGDKLELVSGVGLKNNGFFINNKKMDEYRVKQLLEGASC